MKTLAKEKIDLKKLWQNALAGKNIKDERVFLDDPKFAYLYAKYFRKKRWDEQDEIVFHKDMKCAYLYCVFIDSKVPEHLHNFFLAKKLGNNDEMEERWISEYFSWLDKRKNKKRLD